MTTILIAALVLGGLGLIFGLLLTLANKVVEVPSDPRRDAVRNCLPGANCGGCGFPGCDGLAAALVEGPAAPGACSACSKAASASRRHSSKEDTFSFASITSLEAF